MVGGGEVFDLAEPLEEARGAGFGLVLEGLESEQLVGRHLQGAGQLGEQGARGLGAIGLVVGDDTIGTPTDAPSSF